MVDDMKVLQINAVYGTGSTGVIVEDIHKMCLTKGIDSYVAYSTSPVRDIHNGYRIGGTVGKKMHALLSRINGKQAYFSRSATKKLLRHIDIIKPDIVHLHNLHSNYINLNMLLDYLAKKDINTVITFHDCWYFTGGCFHYTSENCYRWTSGCGNCPKKKKDTPAILFDCSSKILKDRIKYLIAIPRLTIVGVSDWIVGEAKKTFLKDVASVTIHNGIDTSFFKNTPSDLKTKYGIEGKFVVLGLASKWFLKVNKETFDKVVSGLPIDCVLMLLGCTEEQRKNLPENVIGIPFVKDREELRKIYSMADVFVNCTREDSFPLANLEPQACGTPVITYCNTGAKETVDGKSGFAVENGNADEMLDRILTVKEKGKDCFSDSCRTWAVNSFDRDENYEKYIKLFYRLIMGK